MRAWMIVVCALALAGCKKEQDVVVYTPDEKRTETSVVDGDPMALLPSGIVGLVAADAQALFAAEFGNELLAVADRFAPVPRASGFDPKRDLDRLVVASYSMQGIDTLGVARGKFDAEAIARSVESGQPSPLGMPLSKSSYAGHQVYTVNDVAFAVLSPKTVLFGTPTALQRALDRIKEGRAQRQLPAWLEKLLATPGAPIVAALDLGGEPAPDALRRQLTFLDGLETGRAVANLAPPGVNLAGTLTYGDETAAQRGAESLVRTEQLIETYSWALRALGIAQPIERIQAEPRGKEAVFVVAINGQAVKDLLAKLPALPPKPPAPDPAPAAPPAPSP